MAQGAQIAAAGDLVAVAGRNLSLGAATTTYQFDTGAVPGGDRLQATQTTQHGSTVTTGGNATLVAQGGDLTVNASRVSAGGDATLVGQNVTLAAGVNTDTRSSHLVNGSGYGDTATATQTAAAASVEAGHALTVQAAGSGQPGSGGLTVTGATLTAQTGSATLQAAHNITVGTLALNASATSHSQAESSGFLSHSTLASDATSASTTQQASTVSGNTVAMAAGHDLGVTGSSITGTGAAAGGGQVSLTAGNTLTVTAAADTRTAHSDSQSRGGLLGSSKGQSTADLSQTTAQASSLAGSAITLQSGSDLTLQAAQITGSSLTAQAGTIDGQVIDPHAQLHLDAAIDDLSESRSSAGHGLLTQHTASQGTVEQTLHYTTIAVPGAGQPGGPVKLQAPGGVTVGATSLAPAAGSATTGGSSGSVPTVTVDLRQQAQQLAQQPGLGYMAQLAQRNDVAWQQVQLASQHWDYHASGLTGVGAAIVAIAVAVATYGAGSALAGSTVGTATTTSAGVAGAGVSTVTTTTSLAGATLSTTAATSAGVAGTVTTTTYGTLGAMLNAGFSSLASQAAVSLVNNGGNIGRTLHDLGSSQSVKSIVGSMLSAGVGSTFQVTNAADVMGNLEGLAANAAAGCISGQLSGGDCKQGAAIAATMDALAWSGRAIRDQQIKDSSRFKGMQFSDGSTLSNTSGPSAGIAGDPSGPIKLGGERWNVDNINSAVMQFCNGDDGCIQTYADINGFDYVRSTENSAAKIVVSQGVMSNLVGNPIIMPSSITQHQFLQDYTSVEQDISPLGGIQGAAGSIFGSPYQPGSFSDVLVESFGGVHDALNSTHYYDSILYNNLPKNLTGSGVWNVIDLLPAAPFGLSVLNNQIPGFVSGITNSVQINNQEERQSDQGQ